MAITTIGTDGRQRATITLWEANEGGDADFFKGLIQAAICMQIM
jgi:hypothetical protein